LEEDDLEREQVPIDELDALLHLKPNRLLAVTEDHILSILAALRARHELFGQNLFSDPAWNILLELYAADLGQREICRADLPRLIPAPTSVTERWLVDLSRRGIIEEDQSTGSTKLSSTARVSMTQLVQQWTAAFISI
jgi:hypothetical protein